MSYDWSLSLVALVVCPPLYLAITRITAASSGTPPPRGRRRARSTPAPRRTIGAVKLVQAYGREDGAVADFRQRLAKRACALSLQLYSTETIFGLVVDCVLALGTALARLAGRAARDGGPHRDRRPHDLPVVPEGPLRPDPEHQRRTWPRSRPRARASSASSPCSTSQPDIQDAPGRAAARREVTRPRPLRERHASATTRTARCCAALDLDIRPGETRRARGPHRRRQEHAGQPRAALLRPAAGPRHDRRPRPARRDAALAARARSRCMLQEPILFHTTSPRTSRFGRRGARRRGARRRARRAEAEPFILELPEGYDDRDGRGRLHPVRRPAPAPGAGARAAARGARS